MGEQRFVGGDDRLARFERPFHRRLRRIAFAADQLNEDVDTVECGKLARVAEPVELGKIAVTPLGAAARTYGDNLDRDPSPAGEQIGMCGEEVEYAGTDGP